LHIVTVLQMRKAVDSLAEAAAQQEAEDADLVAMDAAVLALHHQELLPQWSLRPQWSLLYIA
jgi:hypothetical protein